MKPLKPYIGITGFRSLEQVQAILENFNNAKSATKRNTSQRVLHVGVMTSYNTLHGNRSRFTEAFPKNEEIAGIFGNSETFNCLHYADYNRVGNDLAVSLARAITLGGAGIHALQLDMVWPNPAEVATAIRTSNKNIEVILQVSESSMAFVENAPNNLILKLREYDGVIHRVLLDMSMGKGREMNCTILLPYARAIKSQLPHLGLVVAGGLGPNSMHLVEPITEEFPDVSVDAESQLRPSGKNVDPIDWALARNYLIQTFKRLP